MATWRWILLIVLAWPFIVLPIARAIYEANKPGNSDEQLGRAVKGVFSGLLLALCSYLFAVWPAVVLGGALVTWLVGWPFFRGDSYPAWFTLTAALAYFIGVTVVAFAFKGSRRFVFETLN